MELFAGHEFHRAAEPQPKNISPQRRGERGGRSWERTHPACKGRTLKHAGSMRSQEGNPCQFAKDFWRSTTNFFRVIRVTRPKIFHFLETNLKMATTVHEHVHVNVNEIRARDRRRA